MEKKWKDIEPGVWKPEQKGDNIEGILVNKVPKDEGASMSARYYIENKEGMFFVWGSTVLDDRMQYAKIGQEIRITYEGEDKNKRGQTVKLFRVAIAEKDTGADAGEEEVELEEV